MYSLTTLENKQIELNVAEIRVSKNHLIPSGYYFEFRMVGKLPQCRKFSILSYCIFSKKHISFMPLYRHTKWHDVSFEELSKLIQIVKVVSDKGSSSVEITPELELQAREYITHIYKPLECK